MGIFAGKPFDMETVLDYLEFELLGNTLWQYLSFILIIMAGLVFRRFISKLSNRLLYRLIERSASGIPSGEFHKLLHKPVSQTLMLVFVFLAFTGLSFPQEWEMAPRDVFGLNMILHKGFVTLLFISIIRILLRGAEFMRLVLLHRASDSSPRFSAQVVPFLVDSLKVVVVVFGILIILGSVFGIDIGALVAGLGIGGLAIALAARESLENLFGSLTIFLDKPFVAGDMVTVAGITGVVERVGFRSSRLRTLDKSFVTVPNKKMVDSEVDNLSLRTSRRANYTIGLTYSTRAEQLRAIVKDIQDYIDNHPKTTEGGRVRFSEFGPSSLDIMIVYFVDTMDFVTFIDVREEINYKIMDIVKTHGADFAFPSTSVYIEKNPMPK